MFSKISSLLLEYSIKALGSFKFLIPDFSLLLIQNWYLGSYKSLAYKYILSMILLSFLD